MDKLLKEFHTNTQMHENALSHAKEKGMKLNQMNVFFQPETWDLLTELIAKGEYHTKPTEIHYIDKLTGKPLSYQEATDRAMENVREIYVMELMDRVIWNMFYQICYQRFCGLIHPLCKSYKKGESTRTVARELNRKLTEIGKYDGTKNDLSKFFDSVPIGIIDNLLDELESMEPSAIWKPIREFYHDDRVIVNGEIVKRFGSLKQGCAFACLLADIVLRDIDEEMAKYDVIYYRYSDDFIILGKEQSRAYQRYKEMLKDKGIKLNPKKTEYINNLNWFTFLGFKFKGSQVTVSGKTLKNITHRIKMETITQCRNKKRPLNRLELMRAIDNIQYYFFEGCEKCQSGMGAYLFGAVNDTNDIELIDEYAKHCIRAASTNKCNIYGLGESYGKHGVRKSTGRNVRMNMTKAYDLPRELGWYSLTHMRNKYLQGKEVYRAEILKMKNGYIVEG